jgi:AraC-like DNA-binding protein
MPAGNDLLWAGSGYGDEFGPADIHVHRGFEFGVLVAGEIEMHFDQTILQCRPGDVWFANVFEPHGPRLVKSPCHMVVLVFLPDFVGQEMLGELPWPTLFAVAPEQRPRTTSPELRSRVLGLAGMLRREIEERQQGWESAARFCLLYLLLELSRAWPGEDRPDTTGHVRLSALTRLMPALSLTHSLPWRRVGVTEAAESCGLSRSHFQNLFRATMGMSFGSFALRARLSFVARLVLSTDRPISVIADEAGFVDSSHLDRRFASRYGCTPSEFRRQAQRAGAGRTAISRRATGSGA